MVPYFILGVGLIIAFRVISEFGFFTDIVSRIWGIITPFFYGGILAFILNMPCSAIQRLIIRSGKPFIINWSRALSILAMFLIIIALIAATLNLLIPAIYSSILLFVSEFSNYYASMIQFFEYVNEWDIPGLVITEEILMENITLIVENFDMENLLGGIIAGFGGVALAIFHTFLAIVSSVYLLIEKDKLKVFVLRLVKAIASGEANAAILKYAGKLDTNFRQYIYTQTIDGIILGSIMTLTLFLFGSPYFLVLGLVLGILNYIPYFGSIIGTIIALVVMAFTQGLPTALIAAPIMIFIQQMDGNVIQPKLMGGSFSLSPLLVIISVTIGGAYGGVLGMLVAIPIVAVLKDVLDGFLEYRETVKQNALHSAHPKDVHENGDYGNIESGLFRDKDTE